MLNLHIVQCLFLITQAQSPACLYRATSLLSLESLKRKSHCTAPYYLRLVLISHLLLSPVPTEAWNSEVPTSSPFLIRVTSPSLCCSDTRKKDSDHNLHPFKSRPSFWTSFTFGWSTIHSPNFCLQMPWGKDLSLNVCILAGLFIQVSCSPMAKCQAAQTLARPYSQQSYVIILKKGAD